MWFAYGPGTRERLSWSSLIEPPLGRAFVLQGDARNLPFPDGSVNCIVTSPPYFGLREYEDDGTPIADQVGAEPTPQEFLEALWVCTAEAARVLADDGSLFVNLGDKFAGSGGHNNSGILPATPGMQDPKRSAPRVYNKNSTFGSVTLPVKCMFNLPARYAIGCTDRLGLVQRAEIIWAKTAPMPNSRKDTPNYGHETWYHFTRRSVGYYSDIDPIREPYKKGSAKRYAAAFTGQHARVLEAGVFPGREKVKPPQKVMKQHPLGKVPSSVWHIGTAHIGKVPAHLPQHFAAFPEEWPLRFIQAWCPPDGVVLDPFGGSGTVAGTARALGRVGISVDLSADYCRLARWRIFDSKLTVKVRERAYGRKLTAEKKNLEQMSLF